MKFKQYIIESVLHVDIKNLPDWVKTILKKDGIRKPVSTNAGITHNIGSNWHDSNCMDIHLWKDNKVKTVSYCGGPAMNDRPDIAQWKNGVNVTLKHGEMILIINSYPKRAELYVHPDDIKPLLDAPTTSADMSSDEVFSLYITRSIKSSYRVDIAIGYGVDYFGAIKLLKSKNLVSSNGAITTQGKNFLETYLPTLGLNPHTNEFALADKLGLRKI
jgi:hypothetical protein